MSLSKRKWLLPVVFAILVIVLGVIGFAYYKYNETYRDTANTSTDFTANAIALIKEFKINPETANKKYTEKILIVKGYISEIEPADSTANIKMIDTSTGDYAIFSFQQTHMNEVRLLKSGQSVSIKGSCSGGEHSDILDVTFISFKRCAIIEN